MHAKKFGYLFIAMALIGSTFAAGAATPDTEKESEFRFRFVGPKVGNRIAAVAGIPGDPSVYYAGAASGGIWKSVDGGNLWAPVFDKQSVAAIGALAVAPSEPSTVWAGTGEAWMIRDSDVMGNGIYKSTDAGKTWTNMGLPASGRIGRIIVSSVESRHRIRLRAGARDRTATGARRLPHQRRRPALGSGVVRWSKMSAVRVLSLRPAQSAHPHSRYVAGGDALPGGQN